jgi:uncharacterized protein
MRASGIYVGQLMHKRLVPKPHAFVRPLYMLYLDLDELAHLPSSWLLGVERTRPLSFRRKDYLRSEQGAQVTQSLSDSVRSKVSEALGKRPSGPIRLLTQVRAFGFVFNPVSFYYCFAPDGTTLEAVVAEITNTPWGERHSYVVKVSSDGSVAPFSKAFHVSPFFAMHHRYAWNFSTPAQNLTVRMSNEQDGETVFRAQLSLKHEPLTTPALLRIALRLPLMSVQTLVAIYIHALVLWLKGTPVHAHPNLRQPSTAEEQS